MSSSSEVCNIPRTEDFSAGATNNDVNDNHRPRLVVFDLDYTLWPFWVLGHVDPPFSKQGSQIVDSTGRIIMHYPDVPEILEYLHSLGIPMAIASRTPGVDGANQLIDLFGWDKYFQYKEIHPGCKVEHFSVFQNATGLPFTSMMFFDDEKRNIQDLTNVGVHCTFIEGGITMQLVEAALQDFAVKEKNKMVHSE